MRNDLKRKSKALLACMISAALALVIFQNCSHGSSPAADALTPFAASGSGSTGSTGNGDFYEGKPADGTYYAVGSSPGACGHVLAILGQIDVSGASASLQSLDAATCSLHASTLDTNSLSVASYDPDFILFGGAIYQRLPAAPDLTTVTAQFNQVFCRFESPAYGFDIIVSGDLAFGSTKATLTSSLAPQAPEAKTVQRVSSLGQLKFTATDFALSINTSNPSLDGLYTGTYTGAVDGVEVTNTMTCRIQL